jgi:1-phosphatidylinositol-4-phosphate 5-kinase
MDYSMLLGLHVPENIEEEQFDRETGITADGGIVASDRNGVFLPEIYYVQIIDILQLYNARKILEHNMKALIYESGGISSIPPDRYCIRFQNFIASYVE